VTSLKTEGLEENTKVGSSYRPELVSEYFPAAEDQGGDIQKNLYSSLLILLEILPVGNSMLHSNLVRSWLHCYNAQKSFWMLHDLLLLLA